MNLIESRLRETIGLDAASVGQGLIKRAVRQRMRNLGLNRVEDYWRALEHTPTEWNELVESVVVSETWFFRDPEPIAAFVRLVRDEWLPDHSTARLRLLSVPCASGEEPFSLVMALLDGGVPANRFQVEAVDISVRALARADQGVYGRNSFRGTDLSFRDRYFEPSQQGFRLDPAVRNSVRFYRGNLLSDAVPRSGSNYDFIFCRNLLIYLDPLMRRKALDKLRSLLTPSGVLFVSPVEHPLTVQHGFTKAKIPLAFACRKAGYCARRQGPARLPKLSGHACGPRLIGETKAPHQLGNPSSRHHTDLETARRLADAGRLKEAAEICEAHLRESGVSAQAYYLLGLVREAGGEPGAIECYRKALYLEPNHCDSLLQMALLLQENGDAARARAFKSRAQRIKLRTSPM
jgi:chemotaxis protein methyltransferase WspC